MVLLHTGCRPNEAAYIVQHKGVGRAESFIREMEADHQATVPAEFTKTKTDYCWLLPVHMNEIVVNILELEHTGYNNKEGLLIGLNNYYTDQILNRSGIQTRDASGKLYSMKSIRKFRATEWVLLYSEYKVMEWKDCPPNPLQHN